MGQGPRTLACWESQSCACRESEGRLNERTLSEIFLKNYEREVRKKERRAENEMEMRRGRKLSFDADLELKTCRQVHHGRSEKANKAHVGNTGDSATSPASRLPRKNKLMLNHLPHSGASKKRKTCPSGLHSSWRACTSCYHRAALHGPV